MTVSRGTFYGVVVVLAALLLISSTTAAIYYSDYQQEAAAVQSDQTELSLALANYHSLGGLYDASLNDYNQTLGLLADAVSGLNTSTPAYSTAAAELASLWSSYQALAAGSGQKPLAYDVSMRVDYGNGTSRWYNETTTQPGWNGYVVTLVLLDGNLQATWYPQYGEHLVTGLNGVNQTATESWFVWVLSDGRWEVSPTGADQMRVDNGTVLAWTLCGYDASFIPSCTP